MQPRASLLAFTILVNLSAGCNRAPDEPGART
ncbi:MAG: hypothetical protein JWM10_1263, partial [Myxococcaceae bacterium]|nr:hypothetical protein [Myxococcaceae bacterium]